MKPEVEIPAPESSGSGLQEAIEPVIPALKEQHFTIQYGATGFSYESLMSTYLVNAKAVLIEDPYIRANHQIQNFVRFCETVVKHATIRKIGLDHPFAQVGQRMRCQASYSRSEKK
ncbi:MIT C-terminal domain-containing protein [Thiorhodococcus mannitoliphagus]|uniref:MIT C-terminal domain-containing protein n=1 Tax=Thiorhodococcus mannitoliphagus TaxID=329406 RepID=UPI0030B8DD76